MCYFLIYQQTYESHSHWDTQYISKNEFSFKVIKDCFNNLLAQFSAHYKSSARSAWTVLKSSTRWPTNLLLNKCLHFGMIKSQNSLCYSICKLMAIYRSSGLPRWKERTSLSSFWATYRIGLLHYRLVIFSITRHTCTSTIQLNSVQVTITCEWSVGNVKTVIIYSFVFQQSTDCQSAYLYKQIVYLVLHTLKCELKTNL